MSICGIIAEYNPFHQGHAYQLAYAKKHFDTLVILTSMYYSQRGLPSLLLPEDKARLCLEHGADLVIGLPVCYTAQSAAYFAKYSLQALHQIPIDHLLFGSESNDIHHLEKTYESIQSKPIDASTSMNHNLQLDILPNDQLALYYVHECKKRGIQPVSMQRDTSYPSATQTRLDYFSGKPVLYDTYFQTHQQWENYYPYLKTFLQLSPPETLEQYFLVNEGIEYRLKKAAKQDTWSDFLETAISKTYSRSRIQRTCLMILLQITKDKMKDHNRFDRLIVLGFNEKGQQLLKGKDCATKFKEMQAFDQFIENQTLTLYNSVQPRPIHRKAVLKK
ncbi:MAG: nucleotidyltransferase family protein [Absicoccus sp.]|uniref:tRNA(Met) cytidine acetate ligase n=1 Tax=Absicoccus intestinalis TaxID=2926319 RepID=A0ABU4WLL8_9FIRM|nr:MULTISPECIES: nucleotidyltransferase family protein [unclassified Absicoccus]MDX8417457.1 nucleotidyltransferase family protein [Absicoccus sp. CLA-KB-P134]MDY3035118.1 nucleotidyltransferase family protein [Absicoccus sp.]